MDDIDDIADDFLGGAIEKLHDRGCPKCGGRLRFSIYKGERIPSGHLEGRFRSGINIHCIGDCRRMLAHYDGVCPLWAVDVTDWDAFSAALYG